ncbi:MAG: DUF2125 domain-containing protein [Acidisphaera sp.]|nr:DUF2125 domain-containing protein [Acidisphaera sp.]
MFRSLIGLLLILLLLAAGDYVLWNWAEQQLLYGYAAWIAGSRVQGWTVSSSEPVTGGWPMEARLTVGDLFLSGGQAEIPGGLVWSADRVQIAVNFLHPRQLSISAEGMQRLRVANLQDIPYTADVMHLLLPLQTGVPTRSAALHAINLRAGLPAGGFTVGTMDLHLDWVPAAQQGEAAVTANLQVEDVGLSSARTWPLGPRIASLSAEAALNGPLPFVPGLAARAAAWRDAGGSLQVRRFSLQWGQLGLSASATVALDDQLQPMGAGTARMVGQSEALDSLAANGAIDASAATAGKAVLALIAHTPEGGGPPQVEVPITLQNRTLSMGRIPLAKLPELIFPAAP